jgi:hypothetical protein
VILEKRLTTKGTKNTKKVEEKNQKIGRSGTAGFDLSTSLCAAAFSDSETCQLVFKNRCVLFALRALRALRGSRLFSIPAITQAFA